MSVDLPAEFESIADEGPFRTCGVCGCDLLAPGCRYVAVNAAQVLTSGGAEPIVEFAICLECAESQMPQPSDQSVEAIIEFRTSRLMRRGIVSLFRGRDPDAQECELCGKSVADCRTVVRRAMVEVDDAGRPRMQVQQSLPWMIGSPAMMCDDCNDGMTDVLSSQTLDDWKRFYQEVVNPVPSAEWDDSPVVFV